MMNNWNWFTFLDWLQKRDSKLCGAVVRGHLERLTEEICEEFLKEIGNEAE